LVVSSDNLEDVHTGNYAPGSGHPGFTTYSQLVVSSANLEDVHTGNYAPGSGHPGFTTHSQLVFSNVKEVSPSHWLSITIVPEDVQPGNLLPVIGHPTYFYNRKVVALNPKVLLPVEGKVFVPINPFTVDKDFVAGNQLNSLGTFCIHFILPNTLETGQAVTPKQVSAPKHPRYLARMGTSCEGTGVFFSGCFV
jgi:hypothetical protein